MPADKVVPLVDCFERGLLKCEGAPELCDVPVRSIIQEPDLGRAIDLVFLSDGFTAAEMAQFRERVRRLHEALVADADGIIGRDPALVNVHAVEVVSAGDAVEERALGSCLNASHLGGSSQADMFRVARASANAPDGDFAIVVVKRSGGWREAITGPPAGPPFIVTDQDTLPETVTHELGHVVVDLADEYVDIEGPGAQAPVVQWTLTRQHPNLSLSPEETWDGLVSGALEGGGRLSKGLYRPTDQCVMNDHYVTRTFCPVCSHAIDEMLAGRRGLPDGAPRCGLWLRSDGTVTAFGRDANGLTSMRTAVGGQPWGENAIWLQGRLRAPLASGIQLTIGPGESIEVHCADADGMTSSARLVRQ